MDDVTQKRCGAARRCRQPVRFAVDLNAWRSLVCEKHAGVLMGRKLSVDTADSLTVTLLPVPSTGGEQ